MRTCASPLRILVRLGAVPALTLALGVGAGGFAPPARGGEPGPEISTERQARDALRTFSRAWRKKDAAKRILAVEALGAHVHAKVARRLLGIVAREKDLMVTTAAIRALHRQTPFAKRIVPRLADRLIDEAEAMRKRARRGSGGFLTDRRTGDADTQSAEGRAQLRVTRQRGAMLLELLGVLDELGWQPGKRIPDLTPFLQDPNDELVIKTLELLARWKAVFALPAVLELYRMYPSEYRWETGAVVDVGGTDATAKARWMVRFGHPDKQRARPAVWAAIQRMLEAVTHRTFAGPESLALYLVEAPPARRPARAR